MSETSHYRIEAVPEPAPNSWATAAILSCACCGRMIDGMGGPGRDEICTDCTGKILSGKYMLVPVKDRFKPPSNGR